jgi:hypothetical protein
VIKIPEDQHGNRGWLVKARKFHRCDNYGSGCKNIAAGEHYYRLVSWPGDEVNSSGRPWIMKICQVCLNDSMRVEFDLIVAGLSETKEQK